MGLAKTSVNLPLAIEDAADRWNHLQHNCYYLRPRATVCAKFTDVPTCSELGYPFPSPKYSVAQVIGYIKGKSAIHLAQTFGGRSRNFIGQHF